VNRFESTYILPIAIPKKLFFQLPHMTCPEIHGAGEEINSHAAKTTWG
jgi:hypothetical protein